MDTPRTTDADFLDTFLSAQVPRDRWDHRAHVRAGYLLVRDHDFDTALALMRDALQRMLARDIAAGHTPQTGYHETITVTWLRVIDDVHRRDAHAASVEPSSAAQGFEAFCLRHPGLLDKRLIDDHYSGELLRSPEAAARFIEPDRAPLPGRA